MTQDIGKIPETEDEYVAFAQYILTHNPINMSSLKFYQGKETTNNPNKQPQGLSKEIWARAWDELPIDERNNLLLYRVINGNREYFTFKELV